MDKKEWFKRKFNQELDNGAIPGIIERLMGTPIRLEEKVANIDSHILTVKSDNKWSIQENVGHLLDLEPLWIGRINDIITGKAELREADLTNKKTNIAEHNSIPIEKILKEFRLVRTEFTNKVMQLNSTDFDKFSLHPRLKTPMRIIDLLYFNTYE